MAETRLIKAADNEAGTFGATLAAATTSTATITPVPEEAPGVIVAEAGTSEEEAIYYATKDAGAGTISGLVRDYTNLNGGTGREHINGASWETMQSAFYVDNIIDVLKEGYQREQSTVARVSGTQFTTTTDTTGFYTVGRLVRFNQSAATIGSVTTSSYNSGTGLTTITVADVTIPNPITQVEIAIGPKNSPVTVSTSGTQTLTNKTITKRVSSTASSTTPTPNADTDDVYVLTALAAGATFGAPTGTPTQGQGLIVRIKDNGTARTLAFNAIYRFSSDLSAPTTTVLSKTLYMGFIYNSTDTKWDCVAILNNF